MEMLHEPEFWVGVGFVIVIAILLWKGVPAMIGRMLDQRAAVIGGELAEAKRLRAEAAALLADYQARAASAEQEAAGILIDAKAEAARFAADSRAALKGQIERRAKAAQDKIAQAEAAAMQEIRVLAADAAASAAQKLIVARLDEKRAAELIADSFKELGAKLN